MANQFYGNTAGSQVASIKRDKPSHDWMLVTVSGYNQNNGYIYGNRHPDGKPVIIARKHSVKHDWVAAMSNNKVNTYTPPKSIIAVFNAQEIDNRSGFTIASWATPISKDLGQESVYVTPIKVANKPKAIKRPDKNGKSIYADAVVLDTTAIAVRTLQNLREAALSVLNVNAPTSLKLNGQRGFMIRIGHVGRDGSKDAFSREFFGPLKEASPDQVWNHHWNRNPVEGQTHNPLKAILTIATNKMRDVNSYIEVVGLTKVLINDFGSSEKVNELTSLSNYKTSGNGRFIPSYSLAAIVVPKQGNAIIKQQIPLPKSKVINHKAGLLGNHIPGNSMPVVIEPIIANANIAQVPPSNAMPNNAMRQNPAPNIAVVTYPLTLANYVSGDGEVRSFHVGGSKDAVNTYRDRIENALSFMKPFWVRNDYAFSFPAQYRNEVASSLSDLTGTPAIYLTQLTVASKPFVAVAGRINEEPFASGLARVFQSLNIPYSNGKFMAPEEQHAALLAGLGNLLTQPADRPPTTPHTTSMGKPAPIARPQVKATKKASKPPKATDSQKNPTYISYSAWQELKFQRDPERMLNGLSLPIAEYAEAAGIDWHTSSHAVRFVKDAGENDWVTKGVEPISTSHKGSVAMLCWYKEYHGHEPGDYIVVFGITFSNRKGESSKNDYTHLATYVAHEDVKEAYKRFLANPDIDLSTVKLTSNAEELQKIRLRNEQRKQEQQREREAEILEKKKNRDSWEQRFYKMWREDGSLSYFQDKGVSHLANVLDMRRGTNSFLGRFALIRLHDLDFNFTGAQQLYEKYFVDKESGEKNNKIFIEGTLFKDPYTGIHPGTHALVGQIDPTKPILFCEGVADAGTLHAATGLAIAICLNKGNLDKVVGLYRQRYPNTRLIIAADSDIYNNENGNGGLTAALDAARAYNAEYTFPDFNGLVLDSKPTDFNDLQQLVGLDIVRHQLRSTHHAPEDVFEFHKFRTQLIGLKGLKKQLNSAVEEIIASGKHGIDEKHIYRILVANAISAYGYDHVAAKLGDDIVAPSAIEAPPTPVEEQAENPFPVAVVEQKNPATGRKYALIKDHSGGDHKTRIENTLKKILNGKHLPYNEHLRGWVAPHAVSRMVNTFLYDLTGAPRLYFSRAHAGNQVVIRGDFADPDFKNQVEKAIGYANPQFKPSENGFVIANSGAAPYIKETLRKYFMPTRAMPALQPAAAKPEVPDINQTLLDEATALSGLSRGDVVLAHYHLVFNDGNHLFRDEDFAFSALYQRAFLALEHLEPETRHAKALEETCRHIRYLLDGGNTETHVTKATLQRLRELVTQLGLPSDPDPGPGPDSDSEPDSQPAPDSEPKPDDHAADNRANNAQNSADSAGAEAAAPDLSAPARPTPQAATVAPAHQENTVATQAAAAPEPTVEPLSKPENSAQLARINELLEICRSAIFKDYNEKDLYNLFITQRGSPYYDETKGRFHESLYHRDLIYLSALQENDIEGWQPTPVRNTHQLYQAIYAQVAQSRVEALENYILGYFSEKGVTTFKTFRKYLTGKQQLDSGLSHPYDLEGEAEDEVDFSPIARDLQYLTSYESIYEFHDALAEQFEPPPPEVDQGDIFGDQPQEPAPLTAAIAGERIEEFTEPGCRGAITAYRVGIQTVYEISAALQHNGRWQQEYHAFNVYRDAALAELQHMQNTFRAGNGLGLDTLPGNGRGAALISQVTAERGDGLTIKHLQIDHGPLSFHALTHAETVDDIAETHTIALYPNYESASDALLDLYREHRSRFEGQAAVLPVTWAPTSAGLLNEPELEAQPEPEPEPPASTRSLSERFAEWAQQGIAFDQVVTNLQSQYDIHFPTRQLDAIKQQYAQLVAKYQADRAAQNASPQARYEQLYRQTAKLAENELTYDEYVEDFFRPDGALVESNPYWNVARQQIDRAAAFEDIKAAGYKSLAQFYDAVFQALHHVSSNELIFRRVGGYIPSHFDAEQPLRPQFENLEALLATTGAPTHRHATLPPFQEWLQSPAATQPLHPIVAEDIAALPPGELPARYNRDALLLLADVHGLNIHPDKPTEELARQIAGQWHARQQLARLSVGEIQNIDEDELTHTLAQFGLPTGGGQKDKGGRLVAHIARLQELSKLRIAEYSYIKTAIDLEAAGKPVPNYVFRSISAFIANETQFKDAANRALLQASRADLRREIDMAFSLLGALPAVERSAYDAIATGNARLIGAQGSDYVSLGAYKYLAAPEHGTVDLRLPGHVTYHAVISDRVFATPGPLDNPFLLANGIVPVSHKALLATAKPVERWLHQFNYATFPNPDGNTLSVAYRAGSAWHMDVWEAEQRKALGKYASVEKLLAAHIESLGSFADRDTVLEDWVGKLRTDLGPALDALSNVSAQLENGASFDANAVSALLARTETQPYIGDHADEAQATRLRLLINKLTATLLDQAWATVVNPPQSEPAAAADTAIILAARIHDLPQAVPTANNADNTPLWQYTPQIATELYDQFIGTDKTQHRELFGELEQAYLQNLSSAQKHALSVDIVHGEYESLGHYLHECALKEALRQGVANAKEIAKRYYADDGLDAIEPEPTPAGVEPTEPDAIESQPAKPETVEPDPTLRESAEPAKERPSEPDPQNTEQPTPLQAGDSVFLLSATGGHSFGEVIATSNNSLTYRPLSITPRPPDPTTLTNELRSLVFGEDGVYLPGLSRAAFSNRPEAMVAPESHLNIDARTQEGREQLMRLGKKQLEDYADILGVDNRGDRFTLLNRIDDYVFARTAIKNLVASGEMTLADADRERLALVVTGKVASPLSLEELQAWDQQTKARTLDLLADRNYQRLQTAARQANLPLLVSDAPDQAQAIAADLQSHQVIPFDTSLPASFYLGQLTNIKELAAWLDATDNHTKAKAHWCLDHLNMSPDDLAALIRDIPDGHNIKPEAQHGRVTWFAVDPDGQLPLHSASHTPKEALAYLRQSAASAQALPPLETTVGWVKDGQAYIGWLLGPTPGNKNTVQAGYRGGDNSERQAEVPAGDIVVVDLDLFDGVFEQQLGAISGTVQEVKQAFDHRLAEARQSGIDHELIQATYLSGLADEHIAKLARHQQHLPKGFVIEQEGNTYRLRALAPGAAPLLDPNANHHSPADLLRAAAVQQRINDRSQNDENSDATPTPEPLGADDQTPLRNPAAKPNLGTETPEAVVDNVVALPTTPRTPDGEHHRTTDGEPPAASDNGVSGTGQLPPEHSPAGARGGAAAGAAGARGTSAPRSRGISFYLPDTLEEQASRSPEARFRMNIKALQLRRQLLEEGRKPTPEEKQVLTHYNGWGGFSKVFDIQYRHQERAELQKVLFDGEYDLAKRSVLTAFYTPPDIAKAMWQAVEHLGFSGGKVLDPSTGHGLYIGAAPPHLAEHSTFIGKEIDPVSASIAQLLYGEALIHNEPYEKAKLPNDYFDLAISNIPFGDINIYDRGYKDIRLIHDYFFAKTLDKVRPGGVVAFITSTGTLDKTGPFVRHYLMERADLLGAIRLPRNTFKKFAGTETNADILFLQKRPPGQPAKDRSWLWAPQIPFTLLGTDDDVELPINQYFIDNPNMVIGEQQAIKGHYNAVLTNYYEGSNTIGDELRRRIKTLPARVMANSAPPFVAVPPPPAPAIQADVSHLKPGNFVLHNNGIGCVEPIFSAKTGQYEQSVVPQECKAEDIPRVGGMIALRDKAREIIRLQLNDTYQPAELQKLQADLNALYDEFTQRFGLINNTVNKRLFRPDPDDNLLLALENYDPKTNTATKTDIFTKATIRDNRVPDKAESVIEALYISLGVTRRVDTRYMEKLTGKHWDDIVTELDGAIFPDPHSNQWQPKEQYLSGNIREKLELAEEAAKIDALYQQNVSALRAAMPDPIDAQDIRVRLGAVWIPDDIICEFTHHIIHGDVDDFVPQKGISVAQQGATWFVRVANNMLSRNEGRVNQQWGTGRLGAHELIEKLLNNRKIEVQDTTANGYKVTNREETIAANQKADAIAREFRDWIWSDPERTEKLAKLYNDRYNVFVEPRYTGASVRFSGLAPTLKGKPLTPRDTQKTVVERYLTEGRLLNAKAVGGGKTFDLVACAIEGKRLGIHKKPLIVVPKNILGQFGRMARELYPNANVLVLTPDNLAKNCRKLFTAKIATGDWDMVVIAQSSFKKIATPPEHRQAVIEDERFALEEALSGFSKADNKAAQLTVKQLERALDKLEKKINELDDEESKDNFLYLDELGVDALLVDEADNFLNLYTPTKMANVPGVNTSSADQAMDMYMAVRYIQQLNGGHRGVMFATGTDVRNTMSDMYTMLRYLAPDVLESVGANNFDSFMNTFGEVVKSIEVLPEGGGYRENSRLAKFINVPEMAMIYRTVAEVLTDEQLNIPKPQVEEINVAAPQGEWLKKYMDHLAKRARKVRGKEVHRDEDNLLRIATHGRLASLDMRLINPNIPDDPNSKVNKCVANVFKEWQAGAENRLTQIIFCDRGIPNKKKGEFSVYKDIKQKLIASGVPAAEIAFVHSYDNEKKKQQLENALNNGDIRIVIASTEKLGVGSNVQERLVAQHNLDAPWRPRDIEQRNGRMERPGNSNAAVRRYNYATVDSFDLFMWETLKRKAKYIKQAKADPRSAAREIEEEIAPTYAEIMAITTANPLVKKKLEIDAEVERLQAAENSHKRAQWHGRSRIKKLNAENEAREEAIREATDLKQAINQQNGQLTIAGRAYDDLEKAAKAIQTVLKQKLSGSAYGGEGKIEVATFGAAKVLLRYLPHDKSWRMELEGEKPFWVNNGKHLKPLLNRLMEVPNNLDGKIKNWNRWIEEDQATIKSLESVANAPFKEKEKLDELLQQKNQIDLEWAEAANDELAAEQGTELDFNEAVKTLNQPAAGLRVG